ncbi:hypothetical protein EBU99_05840 [bacterium]|nr:hypothetical protein [bacterium]
MISFRDPWVILCYHGFTSSQRETLDDFCFVSREKFERDLDDVASAGFRFVDLKSGIQNLALGCSTGPLLSLTFDDGFASVFDVAGPLLQKRSIRATCFLPSQLLEQGRKPWFVEVLSAVKRSAKSEFTFFGREFSLQSDTDRSVANRMIQSYLKLLHPLAIHLLIDDLCSELAVSRSCNSPELRLASRSECELAASTKVFEFGAHSASHAIHSQLSMAEVSKEIDESLAWTKELQRGENLFYAYPNGRSGDFTSFCISSLKNRGVVAALSTIPGWNLSLRHRFALRRFCVGPRTDVRKFLSGWRWRIKGF